MLDADLLINDGLSQTPKLGQGRMDISDEGKKDIVDILADPKLKKGDIKIDLKSNGPMTAEGAAAWAEALERKTPDGLKEGEKIFHLWESAQQIKKAIEKEGGGDKGAKAIAKALEKSGGLKEGEKTFHLWESAQQIKKAIEKEGGGDKGAKAIAKALEKTGGFKSGSTLYVSNDNVLGEGDKAVD